MFHSLLAVPSGCPLTFKRISIAIGETRQFLSDFLEAACLQFLILKFKANSKILKNFNSSSPGLFSTIPFLARLNPRVTVPLIDCAKMEHPREKAPVKWSRQDPTGLLPSKFQHSTGFIFCPFPRRPYSRRGMYNQNFQKSAVIKI
jgi:hypothetical protein